MQSLRKEEGFSLLELLLVCAIIGILGAVVTTTFTGATRRSQVSEASAQLASDLQRARSSAQRFNQNAVIRIATTTATTYTLTLGTQAAITRTLPTNTQVSVTAAPLVITYSAPFGEMSPMTGATLTARSRNGSEARAVRVLGVTGKVYFSEVP